jgi:hypothetical protein
MGDLLTSFAPVFAFKLADEVEKIGSIAGFVAIPGIAVLALLYFGQAREVKRLREWAGRAPERAVELQQRVEASASQQVQTQKRVQAQPIAKPATAGAQAKPPVPVPPAKPATAAAGAAGAAAAPGAPAAGQAAASAQPAAQPGGASATPAPPGGLPGTDAGKPAGAPAAPGAKPPIPAPAGANGGDSAEPAKEEAPVPAAEGAEGPATSAPAPADEAAQPAAAPAVPLPGARPDSPAPIAEQGAVAPVRTPVPPARVPASPLRAQEPVRFPPERRRRGGTSAPAWLTPRSAGIALAALVGLVLVIVVISSLGGDEGPKQANRAAPETQQPASGSSGSQPVNRGSVTVAVLNGTTIPGLAAQVSDQVERGGFKRGTVTNAADQQRPSTTVAYSSGFKRAAQEVARLLGVAQAEPLDASTQAIAGGDAQVVVTVGTDRAQ